MPKARQKAKGKPARFGSNGFDFTFDFCLLTFAF